MTTFHIEVNSSMSRFIDVFSNHVTFRVHPEQINNEYCRKAFEGVVDAGTFTADKVKLNPTFRLKNFMLFSSSFPPCCNVT